jgi:hypothetical protein
MSNLKIGDRVYVIQNTHSPCAGSFGVVTAIDLEDRYGTHLVCLDNGLQFRYSTNELEFVPPTKLLTTEQFAS